MTEMMQSSQPKFENWMKQLSKNVLLLVRQMMIR